MKQGFSYTRTIPRYKHCELRQVHLEQALKNVDDVLRKEAGYRTRLGGFSWDSRSTSIKRRPPDYRRRGGLVISTNDAGDLKLKVGDTDSHGDKVTFVYDRDAGKYSFMKWPVVH